MNAQATTSIGALRSGAHARVLAALALCAIAGISWAASTKIENLDPLDPLLRKSTPLRRPETAVLIAVTRAGNRLVATGEGGTILASDDGSTWRQAAVPVSVTLTAASFPTAQKGWAVGHSGVILHSIDGGLTWTRQLDGRQIADLGEEAVANGQEAATSFGAGDPLLDVLFLDEHEGFAVGAFGLFLHTVDGGATWARISHRLPNPDGNHLYGVRAIGDGLYVVGERGAVFLSRDRGAHFDAVKTPYEGSYFGVTGSARGEVVVFGLQGHAFVSSDHGASWRDIGGSIDSAWTGGVALTDGGIALASLAGDVHVYRAGRMTAVPGKQPPLSAIALASDGKLVAAGPRGLQVVAQGGVGLGGGAP